MNSLTRAAALAALTLCVASLRADMVLGTNFWNLGWHATNDCFNNVNSVTGSNPWNSQFLSDISFYKHLRFMDWDETNNTTRSQWSQRKMKSATNQNPVAYEWMVDLCNRVGADMWVTLPHPIVSRSSGDNASDYATRLAILVKTGVHMPSTVSLASLGDLSTKTAADFITAGGQQTGPALNSGLKVYVEYSNETWNGSFTQNAYCKAEGAALSLDANADRAGYKFHAWAALRLWRGFELVYGHNSPTVVRVLAGWVGQLLMSAMEFQVVENTTQNPWGITASAIAIAPYIGHSATTIDQLAADVPGIVASVRAARTAANQKSVQLFAYEGGQHVLSGADQVNANSRMYTIYRAYLDSINPSFHLFSHYAHVGGWGSGGAWGSMQFTGQSPSIAHKYRALRDFAAEHPVAVDRPAAVRPRAVPVPAGNAQAYALDGRSVGTVAQVRSRGVVIVRAGNTTTTRATAVGALH